MATQEELKGEVKEEQKEGVKETKTIQLEEEKVSVTQIKREQTLARLSNLKVFDAVWFDDPKSRGNGILKAKLEELFNEVKTSMDLKEIMKKVDKTKNLVVVISNGREFKNIHSFVEETNKIIGAIIYCRIVSTYEHYKAKNTKLVGVVCKPTEIFNSLNDVKIDYQAAVNFFGKDKDAIFFEPHLKKSILSAFKLRMFDKDYSVFYPLYLNYDVSEYLHSADFNPILKNIEAYEDINKYHQKIEEALTLKDPIVTNDWLRRNFLKYPKVQEYINLVLRRGEETEMGKFRNYLFWLKASMCKYVAESSTRSGIIGRPERKVYKGAELTTELSDEIKRRAESKDEKSKFLLLRGFTLMDYNEKNAAPYKKEFSKGVPTMFEIQFEADDGEYIKAMKEFDFPESSGVLFPIDPYENKEVNLINKVLLPPFYPIKLVKAELKEEDIDPSKPNDSKGYLKITAKAPLCVYVQKEQPLEAKTIQSVLSLVKARALNKIKLMKSGIMKCFEQFISLCDVIEKVDSLQEIIIKDENIGDVHLNKLIKAGIMGSKAPMRLDLSGNLLTDEGAKAIASEMRPDLLMKELILTKNNISSYGVKILSVAAKECPLLGGIILDDIDCRDKDFEVNEKIKRVVCD